MGFSTASLYVRVNTMNTLGITEEIEYRKVDIAIAQLFESISMFINENFLLSISLAGASEEIFAGLLKAKDGLPIIEKSISRIDELRKDTDVSVMGKKNKRDIIREWNHVKNRTKHHNKGEGEFISFNACDEAYWLIKRALENAKKLGVNINNEPEFDNFIIINACL